MAKLLKLKLIIIVLAVFALAVSAFAFSVSYAKWGGREKSITTTASTGYWLKDKYTIVFDDGTIFVLKPNTTDSFTGTFLINEVKDFRAFWDGKSPDYSAEPFTLVLNECVTHNKANNYFTAVTTGFIKVVFELTKNEITFSTLGDFNQATENVDLFKEILKANGITDGNGIITSSGQVVAMDTPFTLNKGEQLIILAGGKHAQGGMQVGLDKGYGISSGQSSGNISVNNNSNIVEAKEAGTYKVSIVKGNVTGDDGLANIYNWVAIQDSN